MNISSIVITVEAHAAQEVIKKLESEKLCELHAHENNKIIATIEAESIGREMEIVKIIGKMSGVLSAKMAFSYCGEELEKIRDNINIKTDTPNWLNSQSIKAEQINYQGDLKKKF